MRALSFLVFPKPLSDNVVVSLILLFFIDTKVIYRRYVPENTNFFSERNNLRRNILSTHPYLPELPPSSQFRYASLYFITGVGTQDNELITLEIIHRYVEVLDRYFGNVRNAFAIHGVTSQRLSPKRETSLTNKNIVGLH